MKHEEDKTQTTKEDFELFKSEVTYWANAFGLKGYQLFFRHEDLSGNFAEIRYNIISRNAVFSLNTEFDTIDYSPEEIKRTAFHEVCELLLCRLSTIGKARFVAELEIDEEIHNIIRILENTVFKRCNLWIDESCVVTKETWSPLDVKK